MHWFVVSSRAGPPTGGTVFHRMLIGALEDQGQACAVLPLAQAEAALAGAAAGEVVWVDSLFLAALPALARRPRRARLGLLAHYLPSLVALGESVTAAQLTPEERAALAAVDVIWVPSPFMRGCVRRLGASSAALPAIVSVEPGRLARRAARLPEPPVRAVMVAHLVPGKGVEDLLRHLAETIRPDDPLDLRIVGSPGLDPSYARRCQARGGDPRLRGRVRFLGEHSPEETQVLLAAANLFVSASTMESYGMALAEARTLGVPVLARRGGNVAALIDARAGGELLADARAVALAVLSLARDPAAHRRRLRDARTGAWSGRPWSLVAREFAAAGAGVLLEPPAHGLPVNRTVEDAVASGSVQRA